MDSIRKQLAALKGKATGTVATEIDSFTKKLDTIAGPPPATPEEDFFGEPADRPVHPPPPGDSSPATRKGGRERRRRPHPDLLSGFHQRQDALNDPPRAGKTSSAPTSRA